ETEAQAKDIPRGRIMRDETLADLASHPPRTQEELAKVRGLSQAWRENDIGKREMRVLQAAEPLPDAELPDKPKRGAPLGKEGALVADLLKLLLKIRTREIDVAARLLTRSDELEALAAGVRRLPVLEGWRYDVFGRDALELVEGRLGFGVEKGRLKMTRIDRATQAEGEAEAAAAAALADGPDEDWPLADPDDDRELHAEGAEDHDQDDHFASGDRAAP